MQVGILQRIDNRSCQDSPPSWAAKGVVAPPRGPHPPLSRRSPRDLVTRGGGQGAKSSSGFRLPQGFQDPRLSAPGSVRKRDHRTQVLLKGGLLAFPLQRDALPLRGASAPLRSGMRLAVCRAHSNTPSAMYCRGFAPLGPATRGVAPLGAVPGRCLNRWVIFTFSPPGTAGGAYCPAA